MKNKTQYFENAQQHLKSELRTEILSFLSTQEFQKLDFEKNRIKILYEDDTDEFYYGILTSIFAVNDSLVIELTFDFTQNDYLHIYEKDFPEYFEASNLQDYYRLIMKENGCPETKNNEKTISEIEFRLDELREEIIGKIKSLLETCENKTLTWNPENITKCNNAFVFYSDEDGFSYEGTVNKIYIDEQNDLTINVENVDFSTELSEKYYDYALRSHRWLIDIFNVMCEVLETTPETV